ncbi:MAG: DUF2865 domain-containing protein [Methylocystis sp.]|nr:DUF2865 domain-containing protein [Methylocystis sp.]MCA3583111.1 DUF2865 domain-containing protein [Methylocystis sp.]MCA3588384.1 DUF2865 domain-containing protein [Methylocystis sp.]MCA3593260.1 DUF2865 domain-containing protein [Methylocystis sp.]
MPRSVCIRSPLRRLMAAFGMLLMLGGAAFADICRAIEAELAAGSRASSAREQQRAQRAAVEAQRLFAHMRSIGCDRTGLFFIASAPPECRGYRAQLADLQAQSQAAAPPNGVRRRQLQSMHIAYNCRTPPQPPEPRSVPLTAGLFDTGIRLRSELDTLDIDRPPTVSRLRGKPICVRMCDGFFFPLENRNALLRDEGDSLCQSLCPAAKTKLFFQTNRIEDARDSAGALYADTRNAFRYRKSYDASCSCLPQGETWGERQSVIINPEDSGQPNGFGILNGDPAGQPNSFDILNGDPAGQADAPLRGMTPIPGRRRDERLFGNRPPPMPTAPPLPPDVPADRLIPGDQGVVREMRGRDGLKRSVRVIAPELSPDPSAAGAPPTPGRGPGP